VNQSQTKVQDWIRKWCSLQQPARYH